VSELPYGGDRGIIAPKYDEGWERSGACAVRLGWERGVAGGGFGDRSAELRGQARKSATLRVGERAADIRDLNRRDGQAGQLPRRNPAQWPW
jgi:hypothetical protein